jgi:hypothetical protein
LVAIWENKKKRSDRVCLSAALWPRCVSHSTRFNLKWANCIFSPPNTLKLEVLLVAAVGSDKDDDFTEKLFTTAAVLPILVSRLLCGSCPLESAPIAERTVAPRPRALLWGGLYATPRARPFRAFIHDGPLPAAKVTKPKQAGRRRVE